MVEIVWEFQVSAGREQEFEKHYGPEGTWVQFFRKDRAYQGTKLLRDSETAGRYLTVDRWNDLAAYEGFRAEHAGEYKRIDEQMEALTQNEARVGVFEVVGQQSLVGSR